MLEGNIKRDLKPDPQSLRKHLRRVICSRLLGQNNQRNITVPRFHQKNVIINHYIIANLFCGEKKTEKYQAL